MEGKGRYTKSQDVIFQLLMNEWYTPPLPLPSEAARRLFIPLLGT